MTTEEENRKAYELRMSIEGSLWELLDLGMTVEDVEEFVDEVVASMREDVDEQG